VIKTAIGPKIVNQKKKVGSAPQLIMNIYNNSVNCDF
jgi:hypothetical protein